MPIYEFQCQACGHRFERLQKMSDADPSNCPQCGEPRVGRMLSAPQFRLAGGGWYETDFKKDGDKKRNLTDKAEPTAKTDGAAETKPAAKSEPKPEAKAETKSETKPTTPGSPAQ